MVPKRGRDSLYLLRRTGAGLGVQLPPKSKIKMRKKILCLLDLLEINTFLIPELCFFQNQIKSPIDRLWLPRTVKRIEGIKKLETDLFFFQELAEFIAVK